MKIFVYWGLVLTCLVISSPARAQSIDWQGHTWQLKSASRSGPGPNSWNATNAFVDASGSLHLLITADPSSPNGFACAEIYTTDSLGFGTYQWQIEGRLDTFDPWVVLGLFPYGPPALGPDGSNEIDIEYGCWGRPDGENVGFTIYPDSGDTMGHRGFKFNLTGTYTTSRFTWGSQGIEFWLMGGFQPAGKTANVIDTWNYTPTNAATTIPQRAMPLHLNLWLDKGHAPANGKPAEVIIHSFTKV